MALDTPCLPPPPVSTDPLVSIPAMFSSQKVRVSWRQLMQLLATKVSTSGILLHFELAPDSSVELR
jgi:hypothetical protein